MVMVRSSQVVALELVNALTVVIAMSLITTGVTAGLLASGAFTMAKPVKKEVGIKFSKPPKK